MKRLINNILFLSAIAALAFSVYLNIDIDIKQREQVDILQSQVQQLNTELENIKNQQEFINAVNSDLSDRIAAAQGWK